MEETAYIHTTLAPSAQEDEFAVVLHNIEKQLLLQQREVEITIQELVRKNSLLFEIRKAVFLLSKHATGEGIDIAEKLLERIDRNIVPLQQKTALEQQWTEVHAEFIQQLQQYYPDFTSMECKIAALLKMKLSTSNISAIMFLSKRTVEFHRLNIRKKMGLCKNDDVHLALLRITNIP